jgi:hypothetical protein
MSAPERILAWTYKMGEGELGAWDVDPEEAPPAANRYILATPAALAASPEVQALIREAEARGMQEAYRKACVAVQIVISRNTPNDGGDADPCLIDQLEAVESLIKREAAALRKDEETPK